MAILIIVIILTKATWNGFLSLWVLERGVRWQEVLMANDSGSTGILGVIVGVMLVLGLIYFAFGEKLGVRTSGPSTTVSVNTPKAPTPGK